MRLSGSSAVPIAATILTISSIAMGATTAFSSSEISMETPTQLSSPQVLDLAARLLGDGAAASTTASTASPWALLLYKYATWASSMGQWIAVEDEFSGTCVVQVIPNEANGDARKASLWKMRLWLIPEKNTSARNEEQHILDTHRLVWKMARATAGFITESLPAKTQLVKISVAALDRALLEPVTKALQEEEALGIKTDYLYPCGLYGSSTDLSTLQHDTCLNKSYKFRKLSPSDAELVNSQWEYKSSTSLAMVLSMINDPGCCCLGVVENRSNGELCAWILQYKDGLLGMLRCQERHRRKGLASALVTKATNTMALEGGEMQAFACIVDTNEASQNLFKRLGWKRLSHADWVGFTSQKPIIDNEMIRNSSILSKGKREDATLLFFALGGGDV